jgi:hypothetical protein
MHLRGEVIKWGKGRVSGGTRLLLRAHKARHVRNNFDGWPAERHQYRRITGA